MNTSGQKSPYFYCVQLFGWRIYFSRHRLKHRSPNNTTRSKKRLLCRKERLNIADNHCEMCGTDIDIRCSLHHLLPVGHPERNTAPYCRVVCPVCSDYIQQAGGIRHIIEKGGEV